MFQRLHKFANRLLRRLRPHATRVLMLCFTFAAFTISIGHALFFFYLDGSKTGESEGDRFLRQSYTTTVSLLLVTMFKTCVLAAAALSFTQYLWLVLRRETLAISGIEQVFSLRSNPFHLARYTLAFRMPILFLMAVFIWLVPLAAIYPPSALTVVSRPSAPTREVGVPFLFPLRPEYDFETEDIIRPRLGDHYVGGFYAPDPRFIQFSYRSETKLLRGMTEALFLSGEIPQFSSPHGDNASYSLEFMGPRLTCTDTLTTLTNDSTYDYPLATLAGYDIAWSGLTEAGPSLLIRDMRDVFVETPEQSEEWLFEWNPFAEYNSSNAYHGQYHLRTCTPEVATYEVHISYQSTSRQIHYSTRDAMPLQFKSDRHWNQNETDATLWQESRRNKALFPLPDQYKTILGLWDIWAILDASLRLLKYDCRFDIHEKGSLSLENGTHIEGFRPEVFCYYDGTSQVALDRSLFNPQRFNESNVYFTPWEVMTEDAINSFLANVTIAALSLNIAEATTNVTYLEYHTTYSFSAPVNLIVPYGLMALFTVIFTMIGLLSIHENGIPAIEGGFMQIMTTTVGRSQMADLVIRYQKSDGKGQPPQELLDLKIRYGELLDDEGVGTGVAGFGTEEETRLLRKGWSSA